MMVMIWIWKMNIMVDDMVCDIMMIIYMELYVS